ncbi:hypothetical protein [Roseisalinus antarcticus]|uniref:Uncharacterized protein n=1 Tax=Roseisalinus antarcticus TaxID=254357 RepID=A0A1Y5RM89_9RHOB|nr:hypothetical protein [Roseisalinus antarcticus]SLN18036.1 hypothetical protein ROA7023_00362 [Roseisalinus antarcticus]
MLILTRDTVRNPTILKVRQLPRKFFGRVTVWPKGKIGAGLFLRILAEFQTLRYSTALLPLIVIALIWNGTALPLSQAPLLMLVILWLVEMRLLRVPEKRRAGLIDAAEAERGLDLLQVQARQALTRIAAGRGLKAGQLHLVVEQSELRPFPPLTYVSVQSEDGPEVLDLAPEERQILRDTLFQPPLDERRLHTINSAQNVFLRDVALDARGVSAHARLSAALV